MQNEVLARKLILVVSITFVHKDLLIVTPSGFKYFCCKRKFENCTRKIDFVVSIKNFHKDPCIIRLSAEY